MNTRRLTVVLSATSGNAVAADREVTWRNVATGRWLGMDTGITGTGTKVLTGNRNAGGWSESKNSDGSFTLEWMASARGLTAWTVTPGDPFTGFPAMAETTRSGSKRRPPPGGA